MQYRTLGNTNIALSAIGLGCMSMNHAYGEPDDKESIATLEKALELGVNFWDTADIYANGANEMLVSQVLKPNRQRIFIATKFGFKLDKGGIYAGFNASPAYVKTAVEASLKRLQTDVIDLYYAHRVDPNVPIEDTVGAMADLVKEGKVRYLGLSEASANTIKRANAVHPISALQSEYSLLTREVETEILGLCQTLKISFVPFSPLARGMVTNTLDVHTLKETDFRKSLPRFQEAYVENNTGLAQAFALLAKEKNCSPAQLAIAWVLAQGTHIIPIPGTKRRKYLQENVGAIDIVVSKEDKLRIDAILQQFPNTGARYSEANNKLVDKS